ncbi:hypothetical protein EXE59_22015 [Nocardioides eburneiflavus]|uniref:Uncharacterized protein n=1 Tax=Nocardioides eburneiflavus TaxID=2518372 RepID=A0A4Z1CMZ3_9ACTN|nr:hypothetical protein [Nocardioides eburneiflavus]TGN66331.1 hypothetical protein EXE59_22015 [Nocardioides eburneiflavus]
MIGAIRTYLVAFLATLLGSLTAYPSWAAIEFPTPIYTYNAPAHSAPRDNGALERGPPSVAVRDTSEASVDRGSNGTSSRPDGVATHTHITDAPPTGVAQGRTPTGTTTLPAELIDGDLLSLQRGHVAANTERLLAKADRMVKSCDVVYDG